MAESIIRRVRRVVSAGVGDALDAAERFTGLGMTREAIRQVESEIAAARRRQSAAGAGQAEAAEQQRAYRREAAGLTEDARFALDRSRPDLAERAIARQLDLEESARRAALSEASHAAEEARLGDEIAGLEDRHASLVAELAEAREQAARPELRPGTVPDIERLRRDEDIAARLEVLKSGSPPKSRKAGRGAKA